MVVRGPEPLHIKGDLLALLSPTMRREFPMAVIRTSHGDMDQPVFDRYKTLLAESFGPEGEGLEHMTREIGKTVYLAVNCTSGDIVGVLDHKLEGKRASLKNGVVDGNFRKREIYRDMVTVRIADVLRQGATSITFRTKYPFVRSTIVKCVEKVEKVMEEIKGHRIDPEAEPAILPGDTPMYSGYRKFAIEIQR